MLRKLSMLSLRSSKISPGNRYQPHEVFPSLNKLMTTDSPSDYVPLVTAINLAALVDLGPCEFSLALQNAGILLCHEIVRIVTGRRLVCKGTWTDKAGRKQAVYCKLFIGPAAKKYAGRDLDGVTALLQSNIATPAVLYAGGSNASSPDHQVRVLVFEALADSINADQALNSIDSQQRWVLMRDLVMAVAEHHGAGLMQADLYPKNFLVQQGRIYTIDGDGIRQLPRIRTWWHAAKNLAILISKFDVVDIEGRVAELLEVYRQRCKLGERMDAQMLAKIARGHLKKVVHGYVDNKVFRQCTDVAVWKNFTTFLAINRAFEAGKIATVLEAPDHLLESTTSVTLKQGNTCTVALADIDAVKVVVKRYNIKSFWHGVGRAFRTSRAAASWSNAFRLRMYGIATPLPIALLEKRLGPIRREAYLLTEYLQAPDVDVYFSDPEVQDVEHVKTARYIAEMFYRLKLLKITHGDLKASNIKISNGLPQLIDLDSLSDHDCHWQFNRQHIRDLRRFMRNWPSQSAISIMLANALNDIYQDDSLLKKAGILTKSRIN
ncbi:MAG TPA: lipopolysaccharide kinase InaA family protein [Methylophilaceae bacterium]|nr:lipopolysaccharide kinase InaA family protein [Methylophilaceae bacterium]